MPNRLLSITILVAWSATTAALIRRDILPGLLIGPPPDLRAVARASDRDVPSRWSILVAQDDEMETLRSIGQATTQSRRDGDGWVRLQSHAWFDSDELLRDPALRGPQSARIEVDAIFAIDNLGNLESLRVTVGFSDSDEPMLVLSGHVAENELEITAQGSIPQLNWTRRFAYEPRQMVQSALSPLDRIPGLQVGQRWSSQVVNPLTGRVERVEVAVERTRLITWDSNPVPTFEVVSRLGLIGSSRSWVRASDGLVLRQEAPLPFLRILLERIPDPDHLAGSEAGAEDTER